MLELLSYGVLPLWLKTAGVNQVGANAVTVLNWQAGLPGVVWDAESDPDQDQATVALIEGYLKRLSAKGLLLQAPQGIWLQSGVGVLASHAGTTPIPAASLTKMATSLAALQVWGESHQFITTVRTNGAIENGVLQGDLIIEGGGDPFFVWEEGIGLGVSLNQLGIQRVTGRLIITGPFLFNYDTDPIVAGQSLQLALNAESWPFGVDRLYFRMAPGTPKPKVTLAGGVATQKTLPPSRILIRHQSLTVMEILKQMNIYSDNDLSELIAEQLGGVQLVESLARQATGMPAREIQLINGSGLGTENQISPRAATALLMAIQRELQTTGLTIADLLPVAGRDRGTLADRKLPKAVVAKTGTLNSVIALAGVIPTQKQGLVWFSLINRGTDWDGLREQQDLLLQEIVTTWGAVPGTPAAIQPHISDRPRLGATQRNIIITDQD